ncbi:hypothetical protein AB205_0115840 [Aquarana catesbeiana]|uniref:Uncharacterized protein n=1 Tax=Aquarana catesbeiana TaxID=8400 RepID=A0A2G9RE93_AQUCT|nr:hypothetical protein AB205_0115840 [Aquarana catesbeiana]
MPDALNNSCKNVHFVKENVTRGRVSFVIDSIKWFSEIGFFFKLDSTCGICEFLRTEQFVEKNCLAQKKKKI